MEDLLQTLNISEFQLKIFVCNMLIMFVMNSLVYLGVRFSIITFIMHTQLFQSLQHLI